MQCGRGPAQPRARACAGTITTAGPTMRDHSPEFRYRTPSFHSAERDFRRFDRSRTELGVELAGEVFQAAVDLDGDHAVAWAEPAGDADGGGEIGAGRGPGEYALGAGARRAVSNAWASGMAMTSS